MCLSPFLRGHREFRRARSRAPLPDGVLAVGGVTDGVWQGGSVMSTLRRGPCRASRHDRGWWKTPRDIIGMPRGSVEVALPRQSPPGVSRFWRIRCHPGRQPALLGPLRHSPLPGVSRFRRIGSHLRRVAPAPARHYGSGSTETGSLLRCSCVEQEAARFRGALKKLF